MKKCIVLFFVITVLLAAIPFASSAPPDIFEKKELNMAEGEYVPAQIVVKFKLGVSDQSIDELILRYRCLEIYKSPFTDTYVLEIPREEAVEGMLRRFREEPSIEYTQPNYVCNAFMTPNDPLYSYQWNFEMINMEEAWDVVSGGDPSVVVAVLDTGVAYENYPPLYVLAPDLAGTTFVPGYDFINDDAHPNDDNSHGTHVTGTIAQTTNNAEGVAGIAFNTAIMPVKVLNKKGEGPVQAIADGIIWATDNGAHVISMSSGFDPGLGPTDLPTLTSAVQYAYGEGVVLVASSGNEGVRMVSLPAAYPEVIAVGAVHSGSEWASYSQYGDALDFVAPGGDGVDRDGDGYADGVLQQTFNPISKNPSDFGYWFFSGTSMAAPHVSGVVALLIANGNADVDGDGKSSPDEIRTVFQATAIDLGEAGRDDIYGWGLIDAQAVMSAPPMIITFTRVWTDKKIYKPGETIVIKAKIKEGGVPKTSGTVYARIFAMGSTGKASYPITPYGGPYITMKLVNAARGVWKGTYGPIPGPANPLGFQGTYVVMVFVPVPSGPLPTGTTTCFVARILTESGVAKFLKGISPSRVAVGNNFDVKARIKNPSSSSQTLKVKLILPAGMTKVSGGLTRTITLAPGAAKTLRWKLKSTTATNKIVKIRVVKGGTVRAKLYWIIRDP